MNQNLTAAVATTAALLSANPFAVAQSSTNATPTQLADVVVQGEQEAERSYGATNAVSALKSDVPLLQTPQAVSIVPRSVIEDQGALKLEDVLKNVAGVSHGGYYGEWDYFRIRGFDAGFSTYLNGLLGGLYSPNEELWGLERVEVVKGPSSTLYGQGPAGGLVNLISKRPQREFFGETRFTAGSWNFYEGAVDVNSPLNKEGTVALRLNALYRNQDSFVDCAGGQRIFIAPALTWFITEDTSLTLLTSMTDDRFDMAFPLPARGTVLPNPNGGIPIDRYIGNPALGNDEWQRLSRLGFELRHRFNEHVSLRNNFRYERNDWSSEHLSYPSHLDADNRTLNIYGYTSDGRYAGFRNDAAIEGTFETGPVEHTMSLGVDYRGTDETYTGRASGTVPLDLFDPNYDAMPDYVYGGPFTVGSKHDNVGIYLQEHARFWEKLTLTLGGRFDWSSSPTDAETAFSPRAGLTYEIVPGLAAYASFSRSFEPQWSHFNSSGGAYAPSTGENFELGLKASALEGRLHGLISIYQLTREDLAVRSLSAPGGPSVLIPEQRVRGFELEGGYDFAPGWQFLGAYTFMDGEVTEGNADGIPTGSRMWAVPEHSFSAWLKYTLQEGPLKGLGAGLGGRYYTEQLGDQTYANPFDLPAYGVMDAAIFYGRGRMKAQVNIENVLDSRHFVGAYNDVYVLPGRPLGVRGSVSWTF